MILLVMKYTPDISIDELSTPDISIDELSTPDISIDEVTIYY